MGDRDDAQAGWREDAYRDAHATVTRSRAADVLARAAADRARLGRMLLLGEAIAERPRWLRALSAAAPSPGRSAGGPGRRGS